MYKIRPNSVEKPQHLDFPVKKFHGYVPRYNVVPEWCKRNLVTLQTTKVNFSMSHSCYCNTYLLSSTPQRVRAHSFILLLKDNRNLCLGLFTMPFSHPWVEPRG